MRMRIVSIDTAAARGMPGVLCVLTGADLQRRGLGTLRPGVPRKRRNGSPAFVCPQPLLAQGRVRYVGDPVAFVVAETLNDAKDAAEAIAAEYEPLPAVITADQALMPGAPNVWDANPGNEAFCHEIGDRNAVAAAFARADRIVRHEIAINRVTANSMEPRGCLAQYDGDQDRRYTIRCTIQSVHATRTALADHIFKVPQHQIRVLCDNMGGGFGMKGGCYPEYALSLWASKVVDRPVRWIAERSEGLMSDEQGRGSIVDTALALDKDGRFLGLHASWRAAIGAYYSTDRPTIPLTIGLGCLVNTYGIPAVHAEVVAVLTNTMSIAPYRGGSRPEPIYVVETIIDKAARELGVEPAELRRRNTIPPTAMPFTTVLGQTYDLGDFAKNLEDCLRLAGYDGVAGRRAAAKARGRLLGVGVATAVAATGGRDYEHAEIRFDASGGVVLMTGSMDHGQGHGTTFKQVLSEKLGIDAELIRYRYGDSDLVTMGIGTFGSRSAQLAGSAIVVAADRLIEKGRRIAGHMLEAATDDIVFAKGRFAIAGTDRSVTLAEVARRSFEAGFLPNDIEPGFTERANFGPAGSATFPSGAHLAEIEIDLETGEALLTRYVAVDDVGRVLNPLLCEGQIQGGIVQGIGQALFENLVYDPSSGQLLSGSFQDYAMPRADDFCDFTLANNPTLTGRNPLGVKGVGEAGTLGAIPAVMNAVNDALFHIGAAEVAAPATPEKLWRAIRAPLPILTGVRDAEGLAMSEDAAARRRYGPPSVSRSLQALAVAVLVLILGATAQQLMAVRSAVIADTERQMARLDMVFAEQTGRAVETVDFILRNVIESLQSARASPPVDAAIFDELLRRRIDGVRQLTEVAIADPDGHVAYSSRPAAPSPLPPAATEIIHAMAVEAEPGLRFSNPLKGPDGKWTALMLRRISDPDGKFFGAAVAFLNLRYFEDFYKAVELTENGAILLHLRDGTVLARYPHDDAVVGQSYAELPPFKDILAHDIAGTVVMDSPIDGSRRVLAIRALKAFPLAVNISVAQSQVLASWRRQTWIFSAVAAGASVAIVGLLFLLAQRSRQVESLLGEYRNARDQAEQAHNRLIEQMAERERAEAALRQAQRIEALGQLTGGVAHDFNNLLTVLIGNIDLLQSSATLDATASERLGTMRAAAERGAMLTGHLLAFARRQPLAPRAVDLNAVVDGMQELLKSALGPHVEMVVRPTSQLWPAMVDPTQIELMILNLVINARDAMPEGGVVTIATRNRRRPAPVRPEEPAAGDYVVVEVGDTGVGMTPEVQAQAFEPFFTTKGPAGGSGLGLSQVFGTARQSGGDVKIESAPGKGTLVSVYLPRAPTLAENADPEPGEPAEPGASRALVLVVDDDDAVRATTADVLAGLGYGVLQAPNGKVALDLLESDRTIDLVLTDVVMSGMSGPDLAREVRASRPLLPIVFISGYADPAGLAAGARPHSLVKKPFRPGDLREHIEAALAASRDLGALKSGRGAAGAPRGAPYRGVTPKSTSPGGGGR